MGNNLNLNTVSLAIEIGAAFGLLVLTAVAMAYVTCTGKRVQDCTQAMIFITLIISSAFQATLSYFDLRNRNVKTLDISKKDKVISDGLYAG